MLMIRGSRPPTTREMYVGGKTYRGLITEPEATKKVSISQANST